MSAFKIVVFTCFIVCVCVWGSKIFRKKKQKKKFFLSMHVFPNHIGACKYNTEKIFAD